MLSVHLWKLSWGKVLCSRCTELEQGRLVPVVKDPEASSAKGARSWWDQVPEGVDMDTSRKNRTTVFIYIYMCVYIYIYVHAYIHVQYIYIYTHTNQPKSFKKDNYDKQISSIGRVPNFGSCEETLAAGEVGFGGQAGVCHTYRGRMTGLSVGLQRCFGKQKEVAQNCLSSFWQVCG